jgi:hypothetical protein
MKGMKNLPFLSVSLCVHGAFTVRFFHRQVAKGAKEKAKIWKRFPHSRSTQIHHHGESKTSAFPSATSPSPRFVPSQNNTHPLLPNLCALGDLAFHPMPLPAFH